MKTRIVLYCVIAAGLVAWSFSAMPTHRPGDLYEFERPKYEWVTPQPTQTFAIPVSGERTITWTAARKAKAKFTFTSSVPINFGVKQSFAEDAPLKCAASLMLSTTVECDLEEGETEVTMRDSRTQSEVVTRAGVGMLSKSANTLSTISPATVTFTAAFFVCVRNCPRN